MKKLFNKKKQEKEKNLAKRIIEQAKEGHRKFLEYMKKMEPIIAKIRSRDPKKCLRPFDI